MIQKGPVSSDSPVLSSEEAISWQKQPSENTYASVMSSSKPTKTSTIRTESELLALIQRKIAKGIPLGNINKI
jgi:hypothetical protein